MISLRAIWAVATKEWKTLLRDHTMVKGIIAQPIILTVIFGFAIRSEVENAPWVVYDSDRTALSRELADEIRATGKVAPPRRAASYEEAMHAFERGEASMALIIPPRFARRIERAEPSPVQLLLNGADPLTALRLSSIVREVAARFHAEPVARRADFTPRVPGEPAVVLRRVVRFNPKLSDEIFFVPTIPAVFLTQLFFGLACFSIVGEKERGTYEHLLALPLGPASVLIGKALPYLAIAYGWFAVYYGLAAVIFGLEIRGSLIALLIATLFFCAASYTIAAFFSVIARNAHQAIYLTVFSVLPSTVISGFMVPTSTMPDAIQLAAYGLPATHYVTILRAVIVRGAGFAEIAGPLALLAIILVAMVGLLLAFYPRRLGS
jgi:ABC-type multidrug transport system permease subunit